MKLRVNGSPKEVPDGLTVAGLLVSLGLGEKPVVVELNEGALLPREHADALLRDGDTLEIVQITAGG